MSDEMNPADAPTPDATTAPTEHAASAAVPEVPTEPVAVAEASHEPPAPLAAEHLTALPAEEEHVALPEHAEIESKEEPESSPAEEPVTTTAEQPAPEAEPSEEPAEPAPKKPRKSRAKPVVSTPIVDPRLDIATDEVATPVEAEGATEASETTPEEVKDETPPAPSQPESKKKWYVVKIQSGREESIKAAIERKMKIEGLEEFYGQIAIPVEEFVEKKKVRVTDKKTGEKVTQEKNVTKARKKYPGYLFAEVEFNDRILYLFRETSGVGDFVGATGPMKPPPPMSDREVTQMLTGVIDPKERGKGNKKTVVKLDIAKGDKVKIRDGAFAGSEGEVKSITEPKDPTDTPKVTVTVTIWGCPVELELDYWHVDKA